MTENKTTAEAEAELVLRTIGAYVEQATRDMLEIGRGFEAVAHAFGELAIAMTRRPS